MVLSSLHSSKYNEILSLYAYAYLVPQSDVNETQASQLRVGNPMAPQAQVTSQFLRELKCGKFIINYEQLSLMENIGQGKCYSR